MEGKGIFRSGKDCVDQIFILKLLVERYREKRKELKVTLMDLGKSRMVKSIERNYREYYMRVELENTWLDLSRGEDEWMNILR